VANPPKVDRHALHEYLYKRANSRHIIRVHQAQLADDLGVNHFTVSRIFREFIAEGRAKKVGMSPDGVDYSLADPANFAQE
jgi:hypothetical protein